MRASHAMQDEGIRAGHIFVELPDSRGYFRKAFDDNVEQLNVIHGRPAALIRIYGTSDKGMRGRRDFIWHSSTAGLVTRQ